MINPQWLEQPMSQTNFHGPSYVPAIEVWPYSLSQSLKAPYSSKIDILLSKKGLKNELMLPTLIQRLIQRYNKNHFIFDPVDKLKSIGCQMSHFIPHHILIPYINLLNLSWMNKCFFEEYGAFKVYEWFNKPIHIPNILSKRCLRIGYHLFFWVEVLRPSQPNGVISNMVHLPNHSFTGQA